MMPLEQQQMLDIEEEDNRWKIWILFLLCILIFILVTLKVVEII